MLAFDPASFLPDSTLTMFPFFPKHRATSTIPATMKFCLLLLVACASSALGKCGGETLGYALVAVQCLHMASALIQRVGVGGV